MDEYPRQIVIPNPLWSFMQHCEVYCTGSCCGIDAFEVHPALLLRRVIDENLSGGDGHHSFRVAWQQLKDLIQHYNTIHLLTLHEEVPFWNDEATDLPKYWLPKNKIYKWFSEWSDAFEKASHYGGLEKD